MHPTPIPARIAALRAAMQQHRLDAYIVPSADPHLSEYLPARWQGRQWLSGFNGSVGTLIVTAEKAGVWVDSRYWTQAEAELAGSGIELMKIAAASSTDHISWLAEQIPAGGRVGADGAVLGLAHARLLEQHLGPRGIVLDTRADLLDAVWPERESLPTAQIYAHSSRFAPTTRAEKLAQVRAEMHRLGAQWHFISTLDDLAWVFNLRGADVNYNPVFLGHALIGPDHAELFVAPGKINAALSSQLGAEGIAVRPYAEAAQALAALPGDASLLLDPRRVTLGFRQAVAEGVKVVEAVNPSTFAKSRKTADEVAFIRQAMEQDGAALCEFFSWLETALEHGETVTELTIDEQITAARARRADFVSPSFSTIAGFRGNGAMPHYRATPESHSVIEGDGLLLIDSGAQYYGGTTDITRMVAVGKLSDEQKRDCSLVLKGVIALSTTHFPKGVRSPMLDAIARAPIWAAGIDYGHGTGHGVGYFLNVHEGPQVIGPSAMPEPHTAMEIGMITSVEPGIYRPGQWGVRIENLVLNVPHETTRFGEFLAFETLTLCPIDTRCLDLALLRPDEIAWLNAYHAEVKRRVTPYVDGAALAWLEKRTAAV